MIDFGRPPLHLEDEHGGITFFPDHADPGLVHYLPDRPRLRRRGDGRPELMLTRYQVDDALRGILGGGLLSMTLELAIEPERLEAARGSLRRHLELETPARLAPVQPERARCRLLLLDRSSGGAQEAPGPADLPPAEAAPAEPSPRDSALVEHILGATAPSLVGGLPAHFLAVLTPTGTRVVEAALRAGEVPLGVVYALDVMGVRPALRGRVSADWGQVYEFLERRFHGGKLLLAVDVGPIVEELEQQQAVRIDIDQLVPESERVQAYRELLEQVQLELMRRFFTPTLGHHPLAEGGREGDDLIRRGLADLVGVFAFTASARDAQRTEQRTAEYDLRVALAEVRPMAPQGMLHRLRAAGGPPFDPDAHVRTLDPGPSPELRYDIGAGVDLAAYGVSIIDGAARRSGREVRFQLTADAPRVIAQFFAKPGEEDGVELDWTAHFEPSAGGGPLDASATGQRSTARVVRLDPRSLIRALELRLVSQGVDWSAWPRVLVDVRSYHPSLPEPALDTLTLDAEHPEVRWSARVPLEGEARLERRLRYVGRGGDVYSPGWAAIEPGAHVVGSPTGDPLRVAVVSSARFGESVDRIVVELARERAPGAVGVVVLSAERPTGEWAAALPALDAPSGEAVQAERAWRYRVTTRTLQGAVRTSEWALGEGARLVVGEGFSRLREVELRLLGPPLAALGLLALKVRLAHEDAQAGLFTEHEALIEDPSAPLRWRYPLADPSRRAWSWQLTRIGADGQLTLEPPTPMTTDEALVVHVLR